MPVRRTPWAQCTNTGSVRRIGHDGQEPADLIPPRPAAQRNRKANDLDPISLAISHLIREWRMRDFLVVHQGDHRPHMRFSGSQFELMKAANAIAIKNARLTVSKWYVSK